MPLFLCRWPTGDCSVVLARTRAEAVRRLDEVGNAEASPLTQLQNLQLHFSLTDGGCLALDGLGEATESEILLFCYPALANAIAEGRDIAAAVASERGRVIPDTALSPATDLGRSIKERSDAPTQAVDRVVSRAARRSLSSAASLPSDARRPPPHLLDTHTRQEILASPKKISGAEFLY